MAWHIVFTKQSQADAKRLLQAGLKPKALLILDVLAQNPFENPPSYEKLTGDLAGFYSRRINIQHRIVYQVYKQEKTVKIVRMWTHYE
ncbi:MAG: Txe/YoeB family addiction module toxin [Candidatus Omnitrophota bacterium]